ncbi:MATE efflux family protein 5 [Acorus calamus]|uniref:Protein DETOXIFICATION n=1 Tax=Acorus calamus TaxID=4465 RepID=A0AAV9EXS4_ACOCL|nr:MATE efflux family protein 5 [Acorus calamus]
MYTSTMCNTTTASLSSFEPLPAIKKDHHLLFSSISTTDNPTNPILKDVDGLHRWPSPTEVVEELMAIGKISGPTALTGLVLYSRSMISMLFLGYLGELELAGGSLSIGFANITGYSVLSGLAMGMEPICGQAFGARQPRLMGLVLHRTVLLLLSVSIPISFLWLNMKSMLLWCGQDEQVSSVAHVFITSSVPDLIFLSFLHPLRIYLRAQNVTLPVTCCSAASVALHVPINFFLVVRLRMGISGVALAMAWTNLNMLILLSAFVYLSRVYKASWVAPGPECFKGWGQLLRLAVPTCVSVCLEWWWYELMILMCGLLANPKASVASMGILIQTTSFVYVFPSSLSLGVSTTVGNELGAGRPARARNSALVSIVCAAALGVSALLFAVMVRHRWARLFTSDEEILGLTAVALPIMGLCELGNCPQTTACGVLRGSARPTVGAHINLGSFYLIGMPVAVCMVFLVRLGFPGFWLGLLAAQASCAALMAYVLANTDWMLQAQRARQLTQLHHSSDHHHHITIKPPHNNNNVLAYDDDGKTTVTDPEEILCLGGGDVKTPPPGLLETDPLIPTLTPTCLTN